MAVIVPQQSQFPSLQLRALRFHLRPREPLWFSSGKAGNTLRGALGERWNPAALTVAALPTQFATPPKPFVIRAAHLDGKYFKPDQPFWFDLHLFDLHEATLTALIAAVRSWESVGLGATRSKVNLQSTNFLSHNQEQLSSDVAQRQLPDPMRLPLSLPNNPIEPKHLLVHFVTLSEMKISGGLNAVPSFLALITRIERRVRLLGTIFNTIPLDPPPSDWFEQAKQVAIIKKELHHQSVMRRSSRTGQTHPIGGFTGWIEYAGAVLRFVPLLQAAYWTGVGRQTSWGKGAIAVEVR